MVAVETGGIGFISNQTIHVKHTSVSQQYCLVLKTLLELQKSFRLHWDMPPPRPNSFNFMQFWGKFGKIVCWPPPQPRGNPGSATGVSKQYFQSQMPLH